MAIATRNPLKIPNLDMLALSSSSSSLSSSPSSLFGHDDLLSYSSQTDNSPLSSPSQEDPGECTRPFDSESASLSQRLVLLRADLLETPKPFSGSSRIQQRHDSLDAETGYEAEVSDDDNGVNGSHSFAVLTPRKRKFMKKSSPLLAAKPIYRVELSMLFSGSTESSTENELGSVLRKSSRNSTPMTPVLCPVSQNLNSPSPMIALPSPRFKVSGPIEAGPYALYKEHSFSARSPEANLPSTTIVKQSDIRGTLPRQRTQLLGLGLSVPGYHPSTTLSSLKSTSSSCGKTKSKPLIGLGISLHGPLSDVPATVKRTSLASLGHGHPSSSRVRDHTRERTCDLSYKTTDRQPTSGNGHSGSINQIAEVALLDVDFTSQRQASVSIRPSPVEEGTSLPKRFLYSILESPDAPISGSSSSNATISPVVFSPSTAKWRLQTTGSETGREAKSPRLVPLDGDFVSVLTQPNDSGTLSISGEKMLARCPPRLRAALTRESKSPHSCVSPKLYFDGEHE